MEREKELSISTAYISGATVQEASTIDISPHEDKDLTTVALAIKNALALVEHRKDGSTQIVSTFSKHTGRIHCIRWVESEPTKIITGSCDCTSVVWSCSSPTVLDFTPWSILRGHTCSVIGVDALFKDKLYAVTTSSDSLIKVWHINENGGNSCMQTINLNLALCFKLRLFLLPTTDTLILVYALSDNKLYMYGEALDNQYELNFTELLTLSGHEGWIRGIDVVTVDEKVMLATCSQDTYIRLWTVEKWKENVNEDEVQIKKQGFTIADIEWTVTLEAVLSGHENWVYGVNWHLSKSNGENRLKLLSASFDKTLVVWEPDNNEAEGVWIEKVRVGEVGGGGLGFYGAKLTNDGNTIIANGHLGTLHIWNYNPESDTWIPGVPCGGHYAEVVDLAWEPKGQFLLTASGDQTTRVHAPWIRDNLPIVWSEIARPQIHGYDMSCLAMVSRYGYVSGAEEKVIRTFEGPHNFIENFHAICRISNENSAGNTNIPEGASVPSLGLSNKAVYSNEQTEGENKNNAQYPDHYFVPTKLKEPPTEETLKQNTLWPEQHKLYGHGFEVFALAATRDGKLIASACKATIQQHAAILIWDTNTWVQVQSLESHNLTVTRLNFSPDDLCLLSVSRDRRWTVFRRETKEDNFELDARTDNASGVHARIIWCCAWTHDSYYFGTASRDGKVVVWCKSDMAEKSWKNFKAVRPYLTLDNASVTAIAFAPITVNNNYLLAAGLESGYVHVYTLKISEQSAEWILSLKLDNNMAHHSAVRRLAFRPVVGFAGIGESDESKLQLASGSNDNIVKIFNISIG